MRHLDILIPSPDARVPFARARAEADVALLRTRGHSVRVQDLPDPDALRPDAVLTYGWRDAAQVGGALAFRHLHLGAGPSNDRAAGATDEELLAAYGRPPFKAVESHAAQREILLQHGGRCWVVPPAPGARATSRRRDARGGAVVVVRPGARTPAWVDPLLDALAETEISIACMESGDPALRREIEDCGIVLVAADAPGDGIAGPALEAAAAGRRVLLADSAPLHELVPSTASICFVPMDDPAAAARIVHASLHDASRGRALDTLSTHIRRTFSGEPRGLALESVLAEVAGREHASARAPQASVWLPLPTSDDATDRRLLRYAFAAPFAEGRRVLDLGCGEGRGAVRLVEAGARSVLAVDPSALAIERARRLRARERLRFASMPLDAITVDDGSIELAVALGDLRDERTRRNLIDEAARVLAPHGTLLIALENRELRSGRGLDHGHGGLDSLRRHLEHAFGNVSLFAERVEPGGVSFRGRACDPSRDAGWIAMATRPRRVPVEPDEAAETDESGRRNAA